MFVNIQTSTCTTSTARFIVFITARFAFTIVVSPSAINGGSKYGFHAHVPPEALANHRWLGPQPPELYDLSWIESIVIARGHMTGSTVRLQKAGGANSVYFGIKGHADAAT